MKASPTKEFHELLCTFETAVLTTGSGEHVHSRPMAIVKVEDNCDLWFITNVNSAKVQEVKDDSSAQVICQEGWKRCIVISGRASLDRDRARIKQFWKKSYQVWFPDGPDDPEIVLIRVLGARGEYWDSSGTNALVYAYEAVKALATGRTPTDKKELHGKVSLEP